MLATGPQVTEHAQAEKKKMKKASELWRTKSRKDKWSLLLTPHTEKNTCHRHVAVIVACWCFLCYTFGYISESKSKALPAPRDTVLIYIVRVRYGCVGGAVSTNQRVSDGKFTYKYYTPTRCDWADLITSVPWNFLLHPNCTAFSLDIYKCIWQNWYTHVYFDSEKSIFYVGGKFPLTVWSEITSL